jgi:hypothetical protein
VDLSKIRGGRQGQQRVAQAVAMESANRVLTRRALDMLKSIATGDYVPPEERQKAVEAEAAPVEEPADPEANADETGSAAGESESESKPE